MLYDSIKDLNFALRKPVKTPHSQWCTSNPSLSGAHLALSVWLKIDGKTANR